MIVLVTGASSGIGYSSAINLAGKGHKVYAAARRMERMEPLRVFFNDALAGIHRNPLETSEWS